MPVTYEPIATTTLGTATNTFSFNSIPTTYTDLKLIIIPKGGGADVTCLRFNSDSSSNYSRNELYADGLTTNAMRQNSINRLGISRNGLSSSVRRLYIIDIFSYSSSTYKSLLYSSNENDPGTGQIQRGVGTWLSTAAINSVTIFTDTAANFQIGTTASLYGILRA